MNFIDLYAGIGGMRIPFEEIGHRCVFSSEIDKYAQITYESFFGDLPYGDITKLDYREISDFDILLAGFPCQPFSMAGLKKGFNDDRGNHFFNIVDILKLHNPSVVFLENVKGLHNKYNKETLDTILLSLKEAGYHVHYKILAAKDFNLPQRRERLYFVGFKDKISWQDFKFPYKQERIVHLRDILEKNPDKKYTISDRLWEGHQKRREVNKRKGTGFGYNIYDRKADFVNTLSARYYKDGSEILIEQSGNNPRMLTPLEAARLQGFPDKIVKEAKKKKVSDIQLYKQFGNAVPVNVIRAIASQIMKVL
ncbi:DNA cytosine methyltransferase [Gammaproteobacteria bacterium]|nr:DNA cytosine methyltransferase [Gammaproteobacteria bacterium]